MNLHLTFYGGLRPLLGTREHLLIVDVPGPISVAAMLEHVIAAFAPFANRHSSVAIAIDDTIVDRDRYTDTLIYDGQHVAFLPPVSGGTERLPYERWLSRAPLDLDGLLAETADPRCGGLVVFSGDIRNHNEGKQAVAITYEAHEAIAARVLADIEQEVLTRFDVHQCRIVHRLDRVEVGQSSVLVVVRAAHRGAAFDGARYAIDELKERVPIWKEEHYDDGTSRFLDGVPLREGPEK
jgi:molybdopterin synthase catalytic subunit/molybdopterin converting factor small subunit